MTVAARHAGSRLNADATSSAPSGPVTGTKISTHRPPRRSRRAAGGRAGRGRGCAPPARRTRPRRRRRREPAIESVATESAAIGRTTMSGCSEPAALISTRDVERRQPAVDLAALALELAPAGGRGRSGDRLLRRPAGRSRRGRCPCRGAPGSGAAPAAGPASSSGSPWPGRPRPGGTGRGRRTRAGPSRETPASRANGPMVNIPAGTP